MNREQKICLWVGIVVIVLMGIFPPTRRGFIYEAHVGGLRHSKEERIEPLDYSFHLGYTFLLTAEVSDIGFGKLIVQWAVVAVVTGGLIYKFRDKKDKKLKDEQKE